MLTNEITLKEVLPAILNYLPVVIVLVICYVIEIKLMNKGIIFATDVNSKIAKAKKLKQYTTGTIVGSNQKYFIEKRSYYVRYKYSINGKQRTKMVRFNVEGHERFPEHITIYYLENKVYTDYDFPVSDALQQALFTVLPWIVTG